MVLPMTTITAHKKRRAVFLSGMLLFSLLALSVTSIAPASAAINATELDTSTNWAGQEIDLEFTQDVSGDIVSIRAVTERDGDGNPAVTSHAISSTVGTNNVLTIRTDRLDDGTYVLRHDGDWLQSDGTFTGAVSNTVEFEVATQTISVTFDETEFHSGENVSVTIDSTRGGYDLNITEAAGALDDAELEQLFQHVVDAGADNIRFQDADNETLTIEGVPGYIEFDANSTGIADNTYEFEFAVTDTTAEDSVEITVLEEREPGVRFVPTEDDPDAAFFEVTDLEPGNTTVTEPIESINGTAQIFNTGEQDGTQTIELRLDDTVISSEELNLDGGSGVVIGFEIPAEELDALAAGEYEYGIYTADSAQTATVVIDVATPEPTPEPTPDLTPTPTPEPTPEPTPTPEPADQPGFGIVLALLAASLIAIRRVR